MNKKAPVKMSFTMNTPGVIKIPGVLLSYRLYFSSQY